MHILLGALTLIGAIIYLLKLLDDAGLIDLYRLDFLVWYRRRKFQKKAATEPLFALTDPKEVVALLVVAVAKIDGDITAEQKQTILQSFQDEFGLSREDASSLMGSNVFLLRNYLDVKKELKRILAPSKNTFTLVQADAAILLMERVARCEGEPSRLQSDFMESSKDYLPKRRVASNKWG